jgi:hypothetical protein
VGPINASCRPLAGATPFPDAGKKIGDFIMECDKPNKDCQIFIREFMQISLKILLRAGQSASGRVRSKMAGSQKGQRVERMATGGSTYFSSSPAKRSA